MDDFYYQTVGEKRQGLLPSPGRFRDGEVEEERQTEKSGAMAEFVIDVGYWCLIQLTE